MGEAFSGDRGRCRLLGEGSAKASSSRRNPDILGEAIAFVGQAVDSTSKERNRRGRVKARAQHIIVRHMVEDFSPEPLRLTYMLATWEDIRKWWISTPRHARKLCSGS